MDEDLKRLADDIEFDQFLAEHRHLPDEILLSMQGTGFDLQMLIIHRLTRTLEDLFHAQKQLNESIQRLDRVFSDLAEAFRDIKMGLRRDQGHAGTTQEGAA